MDHLPDGIRNKISIGKDLLKQNSAKTTSKGESNTSLITKPSIMKKPINPVTRMLEIKQPAIQSTTQTRPKQQGIIPKSEVARNPSVSNVTMVPPPYLNSGKSRLSKSVSFHELSETRTKTLVDVNASPYRSIRGGRRQSSKSLDDVTEISLYQNASYQNGHAGHQHYLSNNILSSPPKSETIITSVSRRISQVFVKRLPQTHEQYRSSESDPNCYGRSTSDPAKQPSFVKSFFSFLDPSRLNQAFAVNSSNSDTGLRNYDCNGDLRRRRISSEWDVRDKVDKDTLIREWNNDTDQEPPIDPYSLNPSEEFDPDIGMRDLETPISDLIRQDTQWQGDPLSPGFSPIISSPIATNQQNKFSFDQWNPPNQSSGYSGNIPYAVPIRDPDYVNELPPAYSTLNVCRQIVPQDSTETLVHPDELGKRQELDEFIQRHPDGFVLPRQPDGYPQQSRYLERYPQASRHLDQHPQRHNPVEFLPLLDQEEFLQGQRLSQEVFLQSQRLDQEKFLQGQRLDQDKSLKGQNSVQLMPRQTIEHPGHHNRPDGMIHRSSHDDILHRKSFREHRLQPNGLTPRTNVLNGDLRYPNMSNVYNNTDLNDRPDSMTPTLGVVNGMDLNIVCREEEDPNDMQWMPDSIDTPESLRSLDNAFPSDDSPLTLSEPTSVDSNNNIFPSDSVMPPRQQYRTREMIRDGSPKRRVTVGCESLRLNPLEEIDDEELDYFDHDARMKSLNFERRDKRQYRKGRRPPRHSVASDGRYNNTNAKEKRKLYKSVKSVSFDEPSKLRSVSQFVTAPDTITEEETSSSCQPASYKSSLSQGLDQHRSGKSSFSQSIESDSSDVYSYMDFGSEYEVSNSNSIHGNSIHSNSIPGRERKTSSRLEYAKQLLSSVTRERKSSDPSRHPPKPPPMESKWSRLRKKSNSSLLSKFKVFDKHADNRQRGYPSTNEFTSQQRHSDYPHYEDYLVRKRDSDSSLHQFAV